MSKVCCYCGGSADPTADWAVLETALMPKYAVVMVLTAVKALARMAAL
jgi:hypothetical protein